MRKIPWISIIGALALLSFLRNNNDNYDYNAGDSYRFPTNDYRESRVIDRDDAVYEYWDEIKDYVNGTEVIDACSYESGNCYSLDADISDGQIELIYFPNGGYLYFSADIDEDGNASDIDQNGNGWDFTLDMDLPLIDDAVYDWASDNGYAIE